MRIGPEETLRPPYLRFSSVTLFPSNEDLSLALTSILRSFNFPTTSLLCAKAECESTCWGFLTRSQSLLPGSCFLIPDSLFLVHSS